MPTLSVITNVPLAAPKPIEVAKKLSAAVAKSTGKPESYVCVSLRHGEAVTFGGSDAPAAHASLVSIGALGTPSISAQAALHIFV